MEQDWGSPNFVQQEFKKWYAVNSAFVQPPNDWEHREYAFLMFHGRGMYRHIQLPTPDDLQRFLRQNTPAHSYHSSSYYDNPTADMAQKGWQGADLVFDIDADHFDLECQKTHDRWWCRNCDEKGTGHPPELCKCGKAQFVTETWLCESCLQAAKHETQKLLDILIQDFGVSPNNLTTNFSGNRGYHVHVKGPQTKHLTQYARREIVDYIMAIGLEPQYHGFSSRNRGARPALADRGWRGRAARALYDFIQETTPQQLKEIKVGRKAAKKIVDNREEILDTLMNKHPSNLTPHIDSKSLKIILDKAADLQASEIDTVVTTDIHRLIRLANSLHGKTGWQVQTIPYGNLPDYEPFREAVVIDGPPVKLRFKWAPEITMNGIPYGPYQDEELELPLGAAIFFLAKKGAMVLDD